MSLVLKFNKKEVMKKNGLAVLLSLMMVPVLGQGAQGAGMDTVKVELMTDIVELNEDGSSRFQFPDFYWDEGALNESNKINTFLQVVELQNVPGQAEDEHIFDQVRFTQEPFRIGTTSIAYQINAQTPSFVSLTFDSEYQGASISTVQRTYNFDLGRGQPFVLEQLLTPQGMQWVQQHVKGERESMVVESIQLASLERYEGAQEDLARIHEIFNICKPKLADLTGDALVFSADSVVIKGSACISSRDDMRLVAPFENKLTFAQLKPHLNDYGRCMLVDQELPCRPPELLLPAPGVWSGKIDNQYRVELVISEVDKKDGSVVAWYYYESQRKLIDLTGNYDFKTGMLTLKEAGAAMTLKLRPDGYLTGQWKQGNKVLSVNLSAR